MLVRYMRGARESRPAITIKTIVRASLQCEPWEYTHYRLVARGYAALGKLEGSPKSPTYPRKGVTVTNDDGRVPWNDLSAGEKAARTTQQTFNLGIVLAGAAGTVRWTNLHRCLRPN